MAAQKLVRTALAASLMFHAAGFVALAAWSARPLSSPVLSGRHQVIQLTASPAEPQWSPEPIDFDVLPTDPPVLIEPSGARIGRRHYVQTPTAEMPLADFALDSASEIALRLPERAARDDVNDAREPPSSPNTRTTQRRPATLRTPDSAVVEPPSSAGHTDDTPPDLSRNAPPVYPALAIQRGWEGTVLLRIWVDETGRVSKVEVARSSGYRILDGAAANAVRQWQATPAMRGGKAVATVEVLPVRFKL